MFCLFFNTADSISSSLKMHWNIDWELSYQGIDQSIHLAVALSYICVYAVL